VTVLLKYLYPDFKYLNFESPDTLSIIQEDPKEFLSSTPGKFIIDEAQRYPEFFSYLQEHVDSHPKAKQIILSGSQNFLLSNQINQTLAGRTAILELLPLTYSEFKTHPSFKEQSAWEFIYHGGYPRPFQENLDLKLWYNSYIRTYLERDVRNLINVKDLSKFQIFLKLCAGRHGQLLIQEFYEVSLLKPIFIVVKRRLSIFGESPSFFVYTLRQTKIKQDEQRLLLYEQKRCT